MSTLATLTTAARLRLDEASAHEWTDAQIAGYLNNSEIWLGDLLGNQVGSGLFRYRDTAPLTAGLTVLALSSLTKTFVEMVKVSLQYDGTYWAPLKQMDDEDEDTLRNAATTSSGIVLPRWRLFGSDVQFLPPLAVTRTVAFTYRYLPAVKTSGTIETPVIEDDLLVLRAAHFAMADRRETNAAFESEYASRVTETIERYQGRQFGARGERVRTRVASRFYR